MIIHDLSSLVPGKVYGYVLGPELERLMMVDYSVSDTFKKRSDQAGYIADRKEKISRLQKFDTFTFEKASKYGREHTAFSFKLPDDSTVLIVKDVIDQGGITLDDSPAPVSLPEPTVKPGLYNRLFKKGYTSVSGSSRKRRGRKTRKARKTRKH